MKTLFLGALLALSLGGSAYAASCCNDSDCCEEMMPCCDM
jgi:hypothetical protein